MASDGRIELELTVKDNASGQVNSIVSDIEHKVNRASGDVKIGLKASDEASKVIDEVKDKTEKGAEGKATLKADDQATSVINAAKENTEKGAEGTATIKADDQASDTIKTVREDYEKGAEGKATVTGDNSDAAGAMARTRTDYERGAEGKATVTGDDEATATLTGVRTDYEKGAEGKATVTGDDEATETLTSVRTDYEAGAEGTATVTGDDEATETLTSVRTDYERGAEGKATVTGDDEATATLTGVRTDYERGAEGTATIKGDNTGARSAVSEAVDAANRGEGKITINGDPTPALGAIEEIIAAANGADVTINLGADGSGAPDGGDNGGGGSGSGIGGKIAGAAWGAAKDVVSGVFSAGMDYEQRLATVATLAQIGNPNADMDAFGRAMMDIASDTGQDVGVVLDAAYNALSSNVSWGNDAQGTSLQNYIRTQAELAVAGRTDVNTAQNATSALMNMYASTLANNPEAAERIGVIDEARIANMMVKGAYKGRFDVGTLATNMSSSMNTAASLGMAPEDVVAMYAVLTQQAISMPAADTGVYRMIASLKDNDSDAAKYMRKAMKAKGVKGINDKTTLGDLINQGYSLQEIVTAMGDWGQSQKKPMALDDMFSLAIAGRAAQGLYNARDFWKESQDYMRGGDQLVASTMGIMSGTTTFSISRIKAQFQSYGAMLYDALAPAVQKVLGLVSGDKFRLLMTNLTNKIARFLESDALENLIDGLVNAAGSLLDVLNGKKSWGDFFGEITGGLKEVGDTVMRWLEDGIINIANAVLDGLPDWLTKGAHIETRSERDAREKKEEAYRQWQTENGLNPEGTYFTAADGNTHFTSSSAYESVRDSLNGIIEPALGLDEEAVNGEVERFLGKNGGENGEYLRRITDEEARALGNGGFEAWYAGQLQTEQNIMHAQNALDQNDIYDARSFNRMAGAAMRTQDPEAMAHLWDVIEAIGDLQAEGKTPEWYAKGEADYSNGVASEEGKAFAAMEAATSAAATSSEDAASGMDDAARAAKRLGSGASDTVGFLSSLSSAAGDAAARLSSLPDTRGYLHAVGLDRVPYDNYPALLHKGEMVLTAAEASAYRFGGTGSSGSGFDVNGLASAIAGMAVQMDGKTVGRLVERSVSQEQGVRYNRQARKG